MNRELIEKTMQHIVDHPEQHDQGSIWSCGTPACFVGWAQHFAGLTYEDFKKLDDDIGWAAENLDISRDDVNRLFYSGNTIPVLQLMVKDVLNGEPVRSNSHYVKELSS